MRTVPRPRLVFALLSLALVPLAAGCEGCVPFGVDGEAGGPVGVDDGGAPPIAGAVSLAISPTDVTLVTDGSSRPSQTFTVRATFEDGSTKVVTDDVALSLSNP